MNRFFLPALLVFLLACAAERPSLIVQSYPFNPAGKAFLIEYFAFDPDISKGVRRDAVQGFGEIVSLDIQRYLKEAGFRLPVVIPPGEAAKGDVLVRGTIIRVQGGDLQKRRWLESTGFGATEVKATGEVIDLASSRSVLAFSLTKQSHYTWLDNEAAVRENLREIAREVAAAIAGMQK